MTLKGGSFRSAEARSSIKPVLDIDLAVHGAGLGEG
jgi:hypothetical protein